MASRHVRQERPEGEAEEGAPVTHRDAPFLLGLHVLSYGAPWTEVARVGVLADSLGYDLLLGADHLYATGGDRYEPFFEGWLTLAAWGQLTTRARLGLLVGANPLRSPAVVAKMTATLDHQTGGRAILGLGAAWHTEELADHGVPSGTGIGERLRQLDESLTIIRGILAGETVTRSSDWYGFAGVRHAPRPIQTRVPVLLGAEGERIGLRVVARHADLWQMWVPLDGTADYAHKADVLAGHCVAEGRDPSTIRHLPGAKVILRADTTEAERVFGEAARVHGWTGELEAYVRRSAWLTTPDAAAAALLRYRSAGAGGFIAQAFAPYDDETIERLATEVGPALRS
jgi:alkanesulfonate monooxygenase SsuD/methylene tetrahydromethanopterin reductase-like flavin-dependent oxidoreductase (luciferase family)